MKSESCASQLRVYDVTDDFIPILLKYFTGNLLDFQSFPTVLKNSGSFVAFTQVPSFLQTSTLETAN